MYRKAGGVIESFNPATKELLGSVKITSSLVIIVLCGIP